MRLFNRLTSLLLVAVLLAGLFPAEARTRRGDRYLAQGRVHEERKEWDAALEAYDKALSEDPADLLRTATAIGARYMGAERAGEYGKRNGVPGELVVRLRPVKVKNT